MKKILIVSLFVLAILRASAQLPYPAPPRAPLLAKLEYFIDRDPGFGNGKPVTLPGVTDAASFPFVVDLVGVAPGFHRVYVRVLDDEGHWGFPASSYFDNYQVPAYPLAGALSNLVECEYFIDTDPGLGNGNRFTFTPSGNIVNQVISINLGNLPAGAHRLYIRTKNELGKWSFSYFAIFDNSFAFPYPTAAPPPPPIGAIEYYIDSDPGFGNGVALAAPVSTDITNFAVEVPVDTLSPGIHTIFFRSRQNPWSLSAYAEFSYASTVPLTWLYVQAELKGNSALIKWATAQEQNTAQFVIEHSADGRRFTDIGTIAAAGTSTTSKQYRFEHSHPRPGFNYYRIRQVDIDGKFSYSKMMTVAYLESNREVFVGPNPATDILHIVVPAQKTLFRREIYDVNGRLVWAGAGGESGRTFSIPTRQLLSGQYIVQLYYNDGVQSHRFIKK